MKVTLKAVCAGRSAETQTTARPPGARPVRGRASALLAMLAAGAAKSKVLLSAGSALISIVAYGAAFGWAFAVGFVALLLAHEMGHVIQLRREGILASAPVFIPFLGAVIGARSLGGNALAEARVGLAGPVLGTAAAILVAIPAALTGSHLLAAIAYTGFLINLFNLLPVVPLDGGRAMAAVSPWLWGLGLGGLIALLLITHTVVLLVVVVLSALELGGRARRVRGADAEYYRVPSGWRLVIGGVYLMLLGALTVGLSVTYAAAGYPH